jgi:hypothetical protein
MRLAAPSRLRPPSSRQFRPLPRRKPGGGGDINALVLKVSSKPSQPAPAATEIALAPGVEAKIIEERQKADAIGLIGQKGSPVVSTAKVASLKHNRLGLLGKAVNDVPAGSIGSWTIIVKPLNHETAAIQPPPAPEPPAREAPATADAEETAARRRVRAPTLLEQSATRRRRCAAVSDRLAESESPVSGSSFRWTAANRAEPARHIRIQAAQNTFKPRRAAPQSA